MSVKFRVASSDEYVSVMLLGNSLFKSLGCAEASHIGNKIWYVNRVIIAADERGKGLGSSAVRRLQRELTKRTNFQRLVVTPGGYGMKQDDQALFYRNNGFRGINRFLYWEPKKKKEKEDGRKTKKQRAPTPSKRSRKAK